MSTKKFDYRIRIQVAADSPDGILLDCLKNERHQSYSHKEMLLWALRAYWMPIAYQLQQEQGQRSVSESQMKRMAQDAIHQLRQQIAYLQSTFGVEQTLSAEGVITLHPSDQLLPLLAAHRMPGAASSAQYAEQTSALTTDSSNLQPESTLTTEPIADNQKDLWYDSEDLFDSQI
ncbi:hypothetical protein [Leptolyngbya sp. GGD]|uniref:hypothetical protein n=1 Tax=Leptolyngbya sp. GGD TaxID=2997907 RepID=UPI00227A605C|nr:hypothetical protein [Leptolyngbya sp. GGD]MCY6493381.1 hypothetical protein [Leptolyngbya sp. GGD]